MCFVLPQEPLQGLLRLAEAAPLRQGAHLRQAGGEGGLGRLRGRLRRGTVLRRQRSQRKRREEQNGGLHRRSNGWGARRPPPRPRMLAPRRY